MATQEIDREKIIDEAMTAIKVIEQREVGIKRHADELTKLLLSFDPGVEPESFTGFDFKLEPVNPDLNSEAVRKWLRDCEAEIAKALNLPDAGYMFRLMVDSHVYHRQR